MTAHAHLPHVFGPMSLIEQIRSIVPLSVISYLCPLLIVGCFLISFRPWLHAKEYVLLSIYTLSVFTYAVIRTATGDVELAAIVGGILAPTLYSVLFIGVGVLRVLRMPYSHRTMLPAPAQPRPNRLRQFLKGAVGGCVGAVTGSTLGVLLSLCLLIITFLLASGLNIVWHYNRGVQYIVDSIVFISGLIGIGLGLLAGLGCFNPRRLGDRLLIHLTIHLFVVNSILKRILKKILS